MTWHGMKGQLGLSYLTMPYCIQYICTSTLLHNRQSISTRVNTRTLLIVVIIHLPTSQHTVELNHVTMSSTTHQSSQLSIGTQHTSFIAYHYPCTIIQHSPFTMHHPSSAFSIHWYRHYMLEPNHHESHGNECLSFAYSCASHFHTTRFTCIK